MQVERWGEEWRAGMRVRVHNRYEAQPQTREGVIVGRSWGRDKGKPIYFGPGELNSPETEAVL